MNSTSYEEYQIKNVGIRFFNADGTLKEMVKFGCVGTLSQEPETQEVVKNCGLETLKKITKTTQLNLTVEGHIEKEIARTIFPLTTEGLKEGIYAFDKDAVAPNFLIVAEVVNLDNTEKKYVAYPNVVNASGFVKELDNSATELAYLSLDMTAMFDKYGKAYYEGYESEITDTDTKSTWLTEWTSDLMQETPEA